MFFEIDMISGYIETEKSSFNGLRNRGMKASNQIERFGSRFRLSTKGRSS